MTAKERTHLVDFYVKHFACECCIPDLLVTLIEIALSMQPFQWELKRQPGAMSPARGGFRPDDPNQQILADEDIYDEYGGFLAGVGGEEGEEGKLPDVLALLTKAQRKELAGLRKDEKRWKKKDLKRKHKRNHSSDSDTSDSSVRIKHSGNKLKSKKRHKMKSKDTSGTSPRSHRRREERWSKSDLDASSAEADRIVENQKHATNSSQIESLVESTRSKRADRSSNVDRSWQKDKRKPDGDVERFERHREIRHTHDNAREQQRQRH
jgi:CBF1 interacting corepressor